jgi:hypothetical protein
MGGGGRAAVRAATGAEISFRRARSVDREPGAWPRLARSTGAAMRRSANLKVRVSRPAETHRVLNDND